MKNLFIQGNESSPTLRFDAQSGIFEIEGDSYLYNAHDFYEPVFKWLEKYLEEPGHDITVNLRLGFFNSGSFRTFAELLLMLSHYQKKHQTKLQINWCHKEDDVDAYFSAQDLSETTGLKFNYITI